MAVTCMVNALVGVYGGPEQNTYFVIQDAKQFSLSLMRFETFFHWKDTSFDMPF